MHRQNQDTGIGFDAGDGKIIRIVRDAGSMTRAGLIEATGWARSTVTRRVDHLVEAGLLLASGSAESSGGRPATLLRFNGRAGHVLAADLGISHSRLAAVDLVGNTISEPVDIELDLSGRPEQAMPILLDALTTAQRGAGERPPLAIVAGLPAPIDAASGRPTNPPILSSWHNYPLAETLTEQFGARTFVENDTNLMALGEQREAWPHARSLVYVKVGTGIGAGIVLDGELHRGRNGTAGDIGHIQLDGHDASLCRCGRHGCVEAIAGGAALSARMRALGRRTETTRDVTALLQTGDSEAKALVREAGRNLGQVLASVVSFANPEVIVLGGDLGSEPLFFGAARAELMRRPLELATKDLQFVPSTLGDDAGIKGAAALSIDRLWPSH